MKTLQPTILILAMAMASAPYAAECGNPPPPPPRGEMKGPPQFDASLCKDKAAGTAVETTTSDGRTIKGTCQVVFLPDRPSGEGRPR
ncbi:MAG: hypothetical protein QMB52_01900 [Propionivibrio sp.]